MTTSTNPLTLPPLRHGGAGTTLRLATVADLPRVARFYASLSADSRYLRFFTTMPLAYEEALHRWAPDRDCMALAEHDGQLIGVAEYVRGSADPARAEIAFAVADGWHHHGIATSMLRTLCEDGQRHGIHTFTAQVMGVNQSMMGVFRESGLALSATFSAGVYDVALSLDAR